MKKALLVFCVIVGVANGDAYTSTYISCVNEINQCVKEYLEKGESHEKAVLFCGQRRLRCYENERMLEKQKSELAAQQAAQQKQARYAKCRNGNADACFDIGYEELSKCEEVDCNQTEALTYFSKSCNLKNKVGCFNTAVILEQNLFFKNHTKAQEYYRKSCNMGYEPACFKVK